MPTKRPPNYAKSSAAFARARKVLVGGVNSPVRAYKAVQRDPIFVKAGKGPFVTDLDGRRYIDYVLSYGPLILGHAPPRVIKAIGAAAAKGTSFGMPTEAESQLAELVIEAVPSIEVVRFVNSGTEATMSAIRLARAATKRDLIIKCTGCYHGHSDALLVQAGSGATTLGVPSSPGVPASITGNTVLVPYNDLDAVEQAFKKHPGKIASMVIEPVAGNMGLVLPREGYLQGLRDLCTKHGALLLFDEVMSGFRVAYGGAQELYGIKPDLTCLGKVIGGGVPVAAYGGRADLMRQVAPEGPVYQAGTLSGNPLAMAAGIATLTALRDRKAYKHFNKMAKRLMTGIAKAAGKLGIAVQTPHVGSMVCCFFSGRPIDNYETALTSDTARFGRFFRGLLDRGVVLPPSQYETWFLSTVHDEKIIDQTIAACAEALEEAK